MALKIQGQHHRGGQGSHATFWPHFAPPSKKMAMSSSLDTYCTSDSTIHVNIVMVSTVLALDAILTDAKKRRCGFLDTFPDTNWRRCILDTFPRCKVMMLVEMRSTTLGLLLHAQYREHFQYWFTKSPWEWFLTPLEKLSEKFFLQLYTPLQKSWCRPCSVC